MRALVLESVAPLSEEPEPLRLVDLPDPVPVEGEIVLDVAFCGVCHTELDEIEGRAVPDELPRVLGHQAVGTIRAVGPGVESRRVGERVGVAWIFEACGDCRACRVGTENLCDEFRATGRDVDGGYAEMMTARADFVTPLPEGVPDEAVAPLLCAGAIGYRSLRLCGLEDGQRLGLTGFGASAHIVLALARHAFPATEVFVFARNPEERAFALEQGAVWAGDTRVRPPVLLDAIIDTTPVWRPIVEALACLAPGGRLVVNAIRKESVDQSALLDLDYARHLWMEKEIKSVANVTRRDVSATLALAAEVPLRPTIEIYPMEEANRALFDLKHRRVRGAKVLRVDG